MTTRPRRTQALPWLALALALFVAAVAVGSVPDPPSASRLAASVLCSSLALGCLAAAGAALLRQPVVGALGLRAGRVRATRLAALTAGMIGTSHLVDLLLRTLHLREGSVLEVIDHAIAAAPPPALLFANVGVALAPGICEELLFRGLLLRALAPAVGLFSAVGISALCFAALHVDFAQALGAGVLGCYLGSVAVASGGTRAPIVCHVANNLAAVAAPAWSLALLGSGLAGGLVAAAAAALGWWVVVRELSERARRREPDWPDEPPEPSGVGSPPRDP